jgi:hypothetical protein
VGIGSPQIRQPLCVKSVSVGALIETENGDKASMNIRISILASLTLVLLLVSCDSQTTSEVAGSDDGPSVQEPDYSVARIVISTFDTSSQGSGVQVRAANSTSFQRIENVNVESGVSWSIDGEAIFLKLSASDTTYFGDTAEYLLNSQSLRVLRSRESPVLSAAAQEVFENPHDSNMVGYTRSSLTVGGEVLEATVYNRSTRSVCQSFIPGQDAAGGWTADGNLVVLQAQEIHLLASDCSSVEVHSISSHAFDSRLGQDWYLRRGQMHPSRNELIVEVRSPEQSALGNNRQIAKLNMDDFSTSWVSVSSASSDTSPVWGLDGDVFFLSTLRSDLFLEQGAFVAHFDSSQGVVKQFLTPGVLGVSSIQSVDLFTSFGE